MNAPLLDLERASVHYDGLPALRDITLRIKPGEKVALVGASGAGKSTLLKLLAERASDDVALVPQELGLVPTLSVFHNVYMARLARHHALYNVLNLVRPLAKEVRPVAAILEQLDLLDKLHEPVAQLSGGQQQRTAVARALHQEAAMLMADEPVSAVDEHQSRRVLDAICSRHKTVVLAMHDTVLAIEYADRLIGLKAGAVTLDTASHGLTPRDLDALYAP